MVMASSRAPTPTALGWGYSMPIALTIFSHPSMGRHADGMIRAVPARIPHQKLYERASAACATVGAMNISTTQLPRIAIASGDPAGIGPEISLKAALDTQARWMCRQLVDWRSDGARNSCPRRPSRNAASCCHRAEGWTSDGNGICQSRGNVEAIARLSGVALGITRHSPPGRAHAVQDHR